MSEKRSLRGIVILGNLTRDALAEFEQRCRWHRFRAGEMIVSHMDHSTDVYFLVSGKARAVIWSFTGKKVAFRDINAGDMFGEMSALDGNPRSASIEALEPCHLAIMSADAFWKAIDEQHQFNHALLRHLTSYVRELTDRVFEFSTLAVNNRLHAELLRLAQADRIDDESATISSPPTHSDIANRISTHREAVTRELNRLTKIDVIKRRGKAIHIKDLSRLERMVHEAIGE